MADECKSDTGAQDANGGCLDLAAWVSEAGISGHILQSHYLQAGSLGSAILTLVLMFQARIFPNPTCPLL